ncbi:polysaccharide pyruvyl transferase family protein [Photobacterium japonica]|uniref:polysaccharide pyruvyl transferase family protein n=1 Tax=Photobacterium japonica TaxID=2910235 RepID=UPI003D0DD7EC
MSKKVCLVGYYGYGNFGDDLMLSILADIFLSLRCSVTVVSKKHNDFLPPDVIQVTSDTNSLSSLYNDVFSKSDIVFWGGGTCFYTSNNNLRGMLGVLKRIFFAKKNKCKFNFLGVGVEPSSSLFGKLIYKAIFSLTDDIICRDVSSRNVLKSYSMKAAVHSDLTYLIEPRERNQSEASNYISFSPAGYKNAYDNIDSIANLLIELNRVYGKKIVLVSLHDGIDEKFNSVLFDKLHMKVPLEISESRTVDDHIEILGNSYFNIGMRLHSIILSDVLNVPVFGVSYQKKVGDYLDRVDCVKYKRYVDINTHYSIDDIEASLNEQFNSDSIKHYVKLERKSLLNCTARLLDN